MFVKPSHPAIIVRDPVTLLPVPAEGMDVPNTNYWRRRLSDGDIVETRVTRKRTTSKQSEA